MNGGPTESAITVPTEVWERGTPHESPAARAHLCAVLQELALQGVDLRAQAVQRGCLRALDVELTSQAILAQPGAASV